MNTGAVLKMNASSKRKRYTDIFRRQVAASQQWKCANCQALLSAYFEIDHIEPLWRGGSNERHNLNALCSNCHSEKTCLEAARIRDINSGQTEAAYDVIQTLELAKQIKPSLFHALPAQPIDEAADKEVSLFSRVVGAFAYNK